MSPAHSRTLVYGKVRAEEDEEGSMSPSNTTLSLRKVNKDCIKKSK